MHSGSVLVSPSWPLFPFSQLLRNLLNCPYKQVLSLTSNLAFVGFILSAIFSRLTGAYEGGLSSQQCFHWLPFLSLPALALWFGELEKRSPRSQTKGLSSYLPFLIGPAAITLPVFCCSLFMWAVIMISYPPFVKSPLLGVSMTNQLLGLLQLLLPFIGLMIYVSAVIQIPFCFIYHLDKFRELKKGSNLVSVGPFTGAVIATAALVIVPLILQFVCLSSFIVELIQILVFLFLFLFSFLPVRENCSLDAVEYQSGSESGRTAWTRAFELSRKLGFYPLLSLFLLVTTITADLPYQAGRFFQELPMTEKISHQCFRLTCAINPAAFWSASAEAKLYASQGEWAKGIALIEETMVANPRAKDILSREKGELLLRQKEAARARR